MYVAAQNPPKEYMKGSLFKFDSSVSFWNFCLIGNYMSHMYEYIIQDVRAAQQKFEGEMSEHVKGIEKRVTTLLSSGSGSEDEAIKLLDDFTSSSGEKAVNTWRDLFPVIITKYHDGYTAMNLTSPTINMHRNGYSEWWLKKVGYFDAANAPNKGPNVIQFEPDPASYVPVETHHFNILVSSILSGCVCMAVGVMLARRKHFVHNDRGNYAVIADQNL